MITILAWYTMILTALSVLFVTFGNDKPLKRFILAIVNVPIVVFAILFLLSK